MNNQLKDLLDFNCKALIERLEDKDIEDVEELLLDCIYVILNFTNQEKVPYHLERTLYSMCVDYNKMLTSAEEVDSKTKSITRGDFKVEFKDDIELKKYIQAQLLQNYSSSLVEFRKLRN